MRIAVHWVNTSPAMLYRIRIPRPPLAAVVSSLWIYRGKPRPHALERLMPSGAAQIIVNLKEDRIGCYDAATGLGLSTTSGTILAGVQSRYSVISTADQEYVAGISFKPGGTVAFTRVPSHETCDADVPLEDLWHRRLAATLRERLLEAAEPEAQLNVLERALSAAWTSADPHPGVAFALDAFARDPAVTRVSKVAAAIALSRKRFIERFKADVGMTPKRYCRILRFQQALAVAHAGAPVDWTAVALDCGYADQPHFIHEFRSLTGLTPGAYRRGRTEFRNHVKFLQDDSATA